MNLYLDEGLHRDFACHLHNEHLVIKVPVERITQIIKDTLDIGERIQYGIVTGKSHRNECQINV